MPGTDFSIQNSYDDEGREEQTALSTAEDAIRDACESSRHIVRLLQSKMESLRVKLDEVNMAKDEIRRSRSKIESERQRLLDALARRAAQDKERREREIDIDRIIHELEISRAHADEELKELQNARRHNDLEKESLVDISSKKLEAHRLKIADLERSLNRNHEAAFNARRYEYEEKINSMKRLLDGQNKKGDFYQQTILEIDDEMRNLEREIISKDQRIQNLLRLQQDQQRNLEIEEAEENERFEMELRVIKEKYAQKLLKYKEGLYIDGRSHQSIINEQEATIASLEEKNRKLLQDLNTIENGMNDYAPLADKLKESRKQLFEDFDKHTNEWITTFEANVNSLHKQYQTIISSHAEQWCRKDPNAAAEINALLNELAAFRIDGYPKFVSSVSREVDLKVHLVPITTSNLDQSAKSQIGISGINDITSSSANLLLNTSVPYFSPADPTWQFSAGQSPFRMPPMQSMPVWPAYMYPPTQLSPEKYASAEPRSMRPEKYNSAEPRGVSSEAYASAVPRSYAPGPPASHMYGYPNPMMHYGMPYAAPHAAWSGDPDNGEAPETTGQIYPPAQHILPYVISPVFPIAKNQSEDSNSTPRKYGAGEPDRPSRKSGKGGAAASSSRNRSRSHNPDINTNNSDPRGRHGFKF